MKKIDSIRFHSRFCKFSKYHSSRNNYRHIACALSIAFLLAASPALAQVNVGLSEDGVRAPLIEQPNPTVETPSGNPGGNPGENPSGTPVENPGPNTPNNPNTPSPENPGPVENPQQPNPGSSNCYGSVSIRAIGTNGNAAEVDDGRSMFSGPGAGSQCLQRVANACNNLGGTVQYGGSTLGNDFKGLGFQEQAFSDDCIVYTLLGCGDASGMRSLGIMRCSNTGLRNVTANGQEREAAWDFNGGTYTGYMDSSCNVLRDPPVNQICDSLDLSVSYIVSPVTLRWSGDPSVTNVSVTDFQLDPAQKGKWYSWEGSEETPLLVYDPEHLGRIVSATQLFGTSSFGKSFKDGYAAMASLDANRDNELSGIELDPLALWFDKNRNGIAEDGEVHPAAASGLKRLFFAADQEDKLTGRISALKGFEAVVNGKTVTGMSVDWFSNAYASKVEALNALHARAEMISKAKEKISDAVVTTAKSEPAAGGLWMWHSGPDHEKFGPKGLLSLVSSQDGLIGHSLVEVPMKRNSIGVNSYIVSSPIKGSSSASSDGSIQLSFVVNGKNGFKTETSATIDKAGRNMTGTSKSEISRNKKGEIRILTYEWSATRIN